MATTATAQSTHTSHDGSSIPASLPHMNHYPQMQQNYQPPLIANENAFLGDVASSQGNVPEKPITSGFFHLAPGTPLIYTYTYHEMKIIVEGDYTITDITSVPEHDRKNPTSSLSGVNTVKAKPGDVFYFPKGVTIKFETEKGGKAFYTGQRAEGEA